MVDPLDYFLFQPVLHDSCKKGSGMCYSVCGMMHIKEPLLLIRKSSPCGSSRFPLLLSVWSFTICLTPYNIRTGMVPLDVSSMWYQFLVSRCFLIAMYYANIGVYSKKLSVSLNKHLNKTVIGNICFYKTQTF